MHASSYSAPPWAAPTAATALNAVVPIPGSKSLTNRELILSSLADSPSLLQGALHSRDTDLMVRALTQLGARIETQGTRTAIHPLPVQTEVLDTPAPDTPLRIDCGLAGTVMRFVPPVAALLHRHVTFDGDAAARRRPMKPLLKALRDLGARISSRTGGLPFEIASGTRLHGGALQITAAASSQFISALLMVGPLLPGGLRLEDQGPKPPSLPHIEMTLDCLKLRGVPARAIDDRHWEVEEAPIRGRELSVEPDLSNAAPFLSAAAVAGGKVGIPDWPTQTTQVGNRFPALLSHLGAEVEQDRTGLFVRGTGTLHGIEIDLAEAGELVPTFSAVLALADSPSTIRGVGHLRGHETNRLRAIVEDLRALGGRAEELEDGLHITPVRLHGGLWKAYGDHRMATAGALLGLVVPGVVVDDIASTTKTLPNFTDLWTGMLAA